MKEETEQLSLAVGSTHVTIAPHTPMSLLTLKETGQFAIIGSSTSVTVIVEEQVAVQPISSVTVYIYVPSVKPDCNPASAYGGVPPVAVTSIEPLASPKQPTMIVPVALMANEAVG